MNSPMPNSKEQRESGKVSQQPSFAASLENWFVHVKSLLLEDIAPDCENVNG